MTYDVAFSGGTANNSGGAATAPQNRSSIPQQRVWAAHNSGNAITVTDCRDNCEEDIGMIFMCQGPGLPAELSVPLVASETGPSAILCALN